MIDYNATYLGRVVNGISQLGNALSGGSPDISVSARIGFMNRPSQIKRVALFWVICMRIVDFTFYPIDGTGHCISAYEADIEENYKIGMGLLPGLVIMTLLMIGFCLLINPVVWIYYFIKTLKNG